jgi:hypothetical protein
LKWTHRVIPQMQLKLSRYPLPNYIHLNK